MFKSKKALLVLTVLMMTAVLAACGSETPTAAPVASTAAAGATTAAGAMTTASGAMTTSGTMTTAPAMANMTAGAMTTSGAMTTAAGAAMTPGAAMTTAPAMGNMTAGAMTTAPAMANMTPGTAMTTAAVGAATTAPATTAAAPAANPNAVIMLYALTNANSIMSFSQQKPGEIIAQKTVTGLASGETLVGIDVRPANKKLYGIGSSSQVYSVDFATGVATKVGSPFTPALEGTRFAVNFNPVADRIRIISDTGQNLRVHPDTGAMGGVDKPLTFATADKNAASKPKIGAAAYTNSFAGTGSTTLFNIDLISGSLVTQNPPNDGIQNTVGVLSMPIENLGGFDVATTSAGQNALVALQTKGTTGFKLYSLDLVSGQLKDLGQIGTNVNIIGITIALM